MNGGKDSSQNTELGEDWISAQDWPQVIARALQRIARCKTGSRWRAMGGLGLR
jgi:hypothetical protein